MYLEFEGRRREKVHRLENRDFFNTEENVYGLQIHIGQTHTKVKTEIGRKGEEKTKHWRFYMNIMT